MSHKCPTFPTIYIYMSHRLSLHVPINYHFDAIFSHRLSTDVPMSTNRFPINFPQKASHVKPRFFEIPFPISFPSNSSESTINYYHVNHRFPMGIRITLTVLQHLQAHLPKISHRFSHKLPFQLSFPIDYPQVFPCHPMSMSHKPSICPCFFKKTYISHQFPWAMS